MSVFIFDDYKEFGLFFKINSSKLLELSSDSEFHEKVNEYVQIFDNAKGGCGCNLNKRRKVAAEKYESVVLEFFTSPIPMSEHDLKISAGAAVNALSPLGFSIVTAVKDILGGPASVHFKKDAADVEAFFKI